MTIIYCWRIFSSMPFRFLIADTVISSFMHTYISAFSSPSHHAAFSSPLLPHPFLTARPSPHLQSQTLAFIATQSFATTLSQFLVVDVEFPSSFLIFTPLILLYSFFIPYIYLFTSESSYLLSFIYHTYFLLL